MKTEGSYVQIHNPESGMLDTTILYVEKFTVQAVFEEMQARKWFLQPGVYVAIRVEGPTEPQRSKIRGSFAAVLTFTVETSERVVSETVAIPA